MKKFLLLLMLICVCSCGAPPSQIPEWKNTAFRQLENYKKSFLNDKPGAADAHFNRARNAIASGNNLNLLARAYLTKYALHTAVLEDFDESEFLRINDLYPVEANFAYYNFLKGKFTSVGTNLIPTQYAGLIKIARNKDAMKALEEISSIDDSLSRLIACGIWVRHLSYNESILQLAINTSAEQGWKKPLWAYLNQLHKYYLARGETTKAEDAKKWLELLKK